MDPYSSGEELHVKARKPYTITKQRERWTEEEHHRFLDALKLYGRAWQRIEEHIGTKTAVQIRSHAQKFFTKLEKEALIKGVPISQALDIEIPPPRPKRKPSNPYPRKTSITVPISQVGTKDGMLSAPFSSIRDRNELDLEKEPITEKPGGNEKLDNVQEKQHKKNCSQGFALFKEGACAASVSSGKSVQTLADSCPLNESIEKLAQDEDKDQSSQPDHLGEFSKNDMQAAYNYPRHVPVHILDGAQTTPDMFNHESRSQQTSEVQGLSNLYNTNPASSATSQHHHSNDARSSIHQSFPCFHPIFTPIRDPDDYRSFLQLSSTFSSLIVSALLQNPAAHAAASFAASFWPYANMEAPSDSPAPSMAAIAAVTVAAATAWWAAHGLLPFHSSFTCIPKSATSMQVDTCEPRLDKNDNAKEPGPECCEEQHSASKLPTVSSSDSEESEGRKLKAATDVEQGAAVTEVHEPNAEKEGKQVDRSSCGSNTTSSSEVETDALGKDENGKVEEPQEPTISLLAGEAGNRRARNCISLNDSWKEVSEEGRLAFQALFSREILPQSFSPSNKGKINLEKVKQILDEKGPSGSLLDLNDLASNISSSHQVVEDNVFSTCHKEDDKKCLPTMELIGQVRLKARRNGFIPYKRCSLEAKDCRGPSCQDEEKSCKRLRLEGEGST